MIMCSLLTWVPCRHNAQRSPVAHNCCTMKDLLQSHIYYGHIPEGFLFSRKCDPLQSQASHNRAKISTVRVSEFQISTPIIAHESVSSFTKTRTHEDFLYDCRQGGCAGVKSATCVIGTQGLRFGPRSRLSRLCAAHRQRCWMPSKIERRMCSCGHCGAMRILSPVIGTLLSCRGNF